MPVGIDQRFSSAHLELNARLSSRQTVATTYTTVALPLISLALLPTVPPLTTEIVAWLGLALPVLGLTFSLWYAHNDLTIGLLSAFLRECEKLENGNSLPSWHSSSQGWMEKALVYRRLSDWAFTVVLAGSALPALINGILKLPESRGVGVFLLLAAFCGVIAAAIVLLSHKQRIDLRKWGLITLNDKLVFQRMQQ